MTDLQLSINDENTSDNGRYPASIAGSSEHTSPQHSSSSRHLQKYNDELYRSLVQESPPHNLAHGTPASEERLTKISRSTPLSSYITGSPSKPAVADEGYARQEERQGEYRTARDWDEIMTRKRTLAQGEKKKLRDGGDQDRKVQQQQSTSIKAQPAELPSYMRVTASFESRTNREGLEHRAAHTNDHPKPITVPRVASKSHRPTFRSTTKINALDEIREELGEGERYISMAERINMYLRGLGNSGNSSSDFLSNTTRSNAKRGISKTSQRVPPRTSSSKLSTRSGSSSHLSSQQSYASTSSSSRSQNRVREGSSQENSQRKQGDATRSRAVRTHIGTYHQSTRHDRIGQQSSTALQRSTHTVKSYTRHEHPDEQECSQQETTEPVTKKQKTNHSRLQVQPFRFATDERARYHQKTFQAKLALWKEKEAAAKEEMKQSSTIRGQKRKADRL
ncbi:hypothetical protein VTP01DRAFT_3924 [Rhizomucor pusillus]|uniref:uncharacterized protein n=1 Tax=Rhizomucor pusillus TaxID=4840 RepID=UPI0037425231